MSIKEHPPQHDPEATPDVLHVPVLLETALQTIRPAKGEKYLDLTAGYGGHARAFLEKTKAYDSSFLVDRDDYAINHLGWFQKQGVNLLHADFVAAAQQLIRQGRQFGIVFVDLGVSSPQLDQSQRGFSFSHDGPLDMRMDRRQAITAATLVNSKSREYLSHIIQIYGEEKPAAANRIAAALVSNRPFQTTKQLADVVLSTYHGAWKRIHPATRTFQALRIATNDELGQIEQLLPLLPRLLQPGGRVGIISFHSLEDRLVKRYFKEQQDSGYEAELQIVTKKPLAGDIYDVHNPRARSAKLRVAVKK